MEKIPEKICHCMILYSFIWEDMSKTRLMKHSPSFLTYYEHVVDVPFRSNPLSGEEQQGVTFMLNISYITLIQQTLNRLQTLKAYSEYLSIMLLSEDFLSFTSSLLERVGNSPLSNEPLSDTLVAGGSNLLIFINIKMGNIGD